VGKSTLIWRFRAGKINEVKTINGNLDLLIDIVMTLIAWSPQLCRTSISSPVCTTPSGTPMPDAFPF